MANSDWANEAFGPIRPNVRALAQAGVDFDATAAGQRLAASELELVDGCETCFAWVFGSGKACIKHDHELAHLRREAEIELGCEPGELP